MTKKCKITDEIIQVCAENIRLGMPYSSCAKAVGITYQTWVNWTKLGQEGKAPYSRWFIAIQQAEAALFKDCLESVRLSMKLGDVKSAYFLLQTRFGNEGYGKTSQVNMKSQNESVNVNVSMTAEDKDKLRLSILEKLRPKSNPMLLEE